MGGIFEIVVDTLIVCTITALIVLVSGGVYEIVPVDQAASMPAVAFQQLLGGNTLGGGVLLLLAYYYLYYPLS